MYFFLNIVEKDFAKMVLEFYLAFEHDELDLAQLDAKLRQFCVKTLKTSTAQNSQKQFDKKSREIMVPKRILDL